MAAINFPVALKWTLGWEGGYCDNPRDPGGATCDGITLMTLCHELGRPATVKDLIHMSPQTIAAIYRKKYWNVIDGDALPAGVDLIAFDICVNSGPGRILPWLRQSSNYAPQDRIRWLDRKRRSFWMSLPIFRTFGKGWLRRENACLPASLGLALAASHLHAA